MANKGLFSGLFSKLLPAPKANTVNKAGGKAYKFNAKHALAQYAATGCLNGTFYANAEQQLNTVLDLCKQVKPEFVARTALYCREEGHMKDMPALLCAFLSVKSAGLLAEIFDRVIDDAKMLRNFVQIMRSGAVGRKSLGTAPRRLVRKWLEKRDPDALFRASVGANPSLADVIKMTHPRPDSPEREALYGYLVGQPHNTEKLPTLVGHFEAFKKGLTDNVPDVPFQMLTGASPGPEVWKKIAENAGWQMTRMNLNTFARHGVFEDARLTALIAARLRNPDAIRKARVFPYQLMVGHASVGSGIPSDVRQALSDAMELALVNVPVLPGKVMVFPDVSGSMRSAVTGVRKGSTSAVSCLDVAALVASALARTNKGTKVIPFSDHVVPFDFKPEASVLENALRLTELPSGGTNCSAPLAMINKLKWTPDMIVYVSDNESWVDGQQGGLSTATMTEFKWLKARNPNAKLVCIDLQPNATTQAPDREDILNIGGFSDSVFDVIGDFAAGKLGGNHWANVIEQVNL